MIYVKVIRAENLYHPAYFKLWGDLLIELKCREKVEMTKEQKRTSKPNWNEDFHFPMKPHDAMIVSLIDKDWMDMDNVVASRSISFHELAEGGPMSVDLANENDEVAAKLVLNTSAQGPIADRVKSETKSKTLRVTITKARGLRPWRDSGVLETFVLAKVLRTTEQTRTRSGPNPEWHETFDFPHDSSRDELHLTLKDAGVTVGTVDVSVKEASNHPQGLWFPIKGGKTQTSGELFVIAMDADHVGDHLGSVISLPLRLVRATNFMLNSGAGQEVTAMLQIGDSVEASSPAPFSSNMIWNEDFVFKIMPGRDSNELKITLLTPECAAGKGDVGVATVTEDDLLSARREFWVPIVYNGRSFGELCLSLSKRPINYVVPTHKMQAPVSYIKNAAVRYPGARVPSTIEYRY